jgi:hypothetical protein
MRERGVIERLSRLSKVDHAVRQRGQGLLIARLFSDVSQARSIARANAARMYLAAKANDSDEFVAAFEQNLALARVLATQGTVLDRLIAGAIDALTVRRLQRHLMAGEVDAPTCRELLRVLDRLGGRLPLSASIEGERLAFLDVVQRTHSDDGNGDGIFLPASLQNLGLQLGPSVAAGSATPWVLGNCLWFAFPSKAQMTAKGNAFYDSAVKFADAPASRRATIGSPLAMIDSLPRRYRLLAILAPAVDSAARSADQAAMEVNATRIMLGIHIFEVEHSHAPAELQELVPGVLASLPSDPLAADLKFRYRRLESPDELGRRFLLYSVGGDGKDDNATPHSKGRLNSLHPRGSEGTDYIINAPEDKPR